MSKGQENQYRNGPRAGNLIMFTEKNEEQKQVKKHTNPGKDKSL